MGWTETHRRWQALQEIEAAANASATDELPWNDEYAEIFGDRATLVAALRTRWEQTRRAQLDSHLPEPVLEEVWCRLRARQAGVLRLLDRYDAGHGMERVAV
jgi:hypothetical protein